MVKSLSSAGIDRKRRVPKATLRGTSAIVPELSAEGYLDTETVEEIRRIRKVRNNIVHGDMTELSKELVNRVDEVTRQLQQKLDTMQARKPQA